MIHAQALTRKFRTHHRTVTAVHGIDLDVDAGEIVGFLGPNGAGKTTTLRMLTTLLAPSSGRATVAGHDLRGDPVGVRRSIGYVAQGASTLPEARAGEECVDQARMFGLSRSTALTRSRELFARLDLEGLWDRPCSSLSGGQRRRLDVALGLVHHPALVFLDEPTTGLDPQARANLWGHVARLRDDTGGTVFLTTHYLDEADHLCDRLLIIDHGRIVAEGTPDHLKKQVGGDTFTITLTDPRRGPDALGVLAGLAGADEPVLDGTRLQAHIPDAAARMPALLRELDATGVPLAGIEVRRPTLDDVFLTLTGRSLRDEPAA